MLKLPQLHWLAAAVFACAAFVAGASIAQSGPIQQVKLGFDSLNKTQQVDLWKRVDEYATVDALQEFCGTKLYLQRRALSAVGTCIEGSALRKVFATFRTKKAEYLKAWETLHGEPEHKKELCARFKSKLADYTKIMTGEIAQAASACRSCFFC